MKNKLKYLLTLLIIVSILYFNKESILTIIVTPVNQATETSLTLIFPSDRFPEAAAHIKSAI